MEEATSQSKQASPSLAPLGVREGTRMGPRLGEPPPPAPNLFMKPLFILIIFLLFNKEFINKGILDNERIRSGSTIQN
jgi:hypothetical protein